mmetsp:Transcript_128018/g.370472  ORF Transcript_128018/g.370472 Transcript_128018/m.370472 type:complete len:289 (-) Transcript_128018:41-907(-)
MPSARHVVPSRAVDVAQRSRVEGLPGALACWARALPWMNLGPGSIESGAADADPVTSNHPGAHVDGGRLVVATAKDTDLLLEDAAQVELVLPHARQLPAELRDLVLAPAPEPVHLRDLMQGRLTPCLGGERPLAIGGRRTPVSHQLRLQGVADSAFVPQLNLCTLELRKRGLQVCSQLCHSSVAAIRRIAPPSLAARCGRPECCTCDGRAALFGPRRPQGLAAMAAAGAGADLRSGDVAQGRDAANRRRRKRDHLLAWRCKAPQAARRHGRLPHRRRRRALAAIMRWR